MTTVPYHVWTPDTGTTELPSIHRGRPIDEALTVPVAWWEGLPAVTRYERRPSLLSRLLRGFR